MDVLFPLLSLFFFFFKADLNIPWSLLVPYVLDYFPVAKDKFFSR